MEKITVLIADDEAGYRKNMRNLLEREIDIEVLGEAGTGFEAIKEAEERQPTVVLMDIRMPAANGIGDGIDATRRIWSTSPYMRVLIITVMQDDDSVFAAMRAGARGYLLKGADRAEVTSAIRAVARGEAIFSRGIAERLRDYFAALPTVSEAVFPELTNRERQVLSLMVQGLDKAEIAPELKISVKTVHNVVSNILDKLQVADRAAAILLAREKSFGRA